MRNYINQGIGAFVVFHCLHRQGGRKMILGGGHHGGRWSDTIFGKGLELHMKDKSVSSKVLIL